MSLLQVFLASLGGFALLEFAWIPWTQQRLRIDRSPTAIARAAMLATFGYVRSVLLISTVTTAAILVLLGWLGLRGGTAIAQLEAVVTMLQSWRARLASFGPLWGGITLVAIVGALGVHAYRSGKRRVERLFEKVVESEYARLRKERQEGRLEELPPTSEMTAAEEEIQKLEKRKAVLLGFEGETDWKRDEIERLAQRIALLQTYVEAFDIGRRIELQLDPGGAAPPAPRTRWEKVQTLLLSRGLIVGLESGSRLLHLAALVLLVPSLMGVCSGDAKRVLDRHEARVSQELDSRSQFQVMLNIKEVEESYRRAKERLPEQERELSRDDEEVLQQAAVRFERTMASCRSWSGVVPPFPAEFEFRTLYVRDQILARFTANAGPRITQHDALSKLTEHLTPVEHEAAQVLEGAIPGRPTTSVGQRLFADLREAAARTPGLVDKVRASLKVLGSPASGRDLSAALFQRVSNLVIDPDNGPLAEVVRRNLNAPELRQALARYQEATRKQFYADLVASDGDLTRAMDRIVTADSSRSLIPRSEQMLFKKNVRAVFTEDLGTVFPRKASPTTGESPTGIFMEKLRNYPPSVEEGGLAGVEWNKVKAIMERIQTRAPSPRVNLPPNPTRAMAVYSDAFPAQLGAESRTPLGRIAAAKPPQVKVFESSSLKFQTARDFLRLRGFADTGGVLIGRRPGRKFDMVDLKWEAAGPRLRLILVGRDGRILRSRPHQMSLISQALAYAADGRPVAVTIVPSPPLLDLKVLLHPVFVDTLLGSRIIALDKFVFEYTGKEAFHLDARKNLDAQMALYAYAWAARVLAISEHMLKLQDVTPEWRERLKSFDDLARKCLEDRELSADAAQALKNPALLAKRDDSPLTVKEKYFDKDLVAIILKSAGVSPAMSMARFDKRLRVEVGMAAEALARSLASAQTEEQLKASGEKISQWLFRFPSFEVTGGVREKAFGSSAGELVMPDGDETSMPFDFSLQIAFTSNALRDAILGGDEKYSNADDDPWDFPGIKQAIHNKVIEQIRADSSGRDEKIVADVSEFVMLQRLFRLALSGDLGEHFPVEKLIALSQIAMKNKPPLTIHTQRWDSYPGYLEALLHSQIEFGLAMLAQPDNRSLWESSWYDDAKRILEARRTLLEERLHQWAEFRQELAQSAALGSDLNSSWDNWETRDAAWRGKWERQENLDAIQRQLDQVPDPGPAVLDQSREIVLSFRSVVLSIDASIAALEMRHALGVSRDDRQADLQRASRIASWRRLMGAVAGSGPPRT
jgi:hypothetical protein